VHPRGVPKSLPIDPEHREKNWEKKARAKPIMMRCRSLTVLQVSLPTFGVAMTGQELVGSLSKCLAVIDQEDQIALKVVGFAERRHARSPIGGF